jgi:uncharacterized phage protein (TIGR01671 family)
MRQIKFRAVRKRLDSEVKEWVYGDLFRTTDKGGMAIQYWKDGFYKRVEVWNETIGQFTGLTDELDREVYEGDIIKLDGSPEMGVRVVVFYEESFNIATRKEYDYLQQGSHPYLNDYAHMDCLNTWSNSGLVRVVGNIYDNPELLED